MEFFGTLDDKGRISLPSKVRGSLPENLLVLTKGVNQCVWVFTPDEWEKFSSKYINSVSLSLNKQLAIQRHFFAPKTEVEIDKAGRIAIPPSLREYAGLSRECKILEVFNSLEIWDSRQYESHAEANAVQVPAILEEMGPL